MAGGTGSTSSGGTASGDELGNMLDAAHIDSINGGSADGYQVVITKTDAAETSFRQALLNEYGSLDNIKYYSFDISLLDKNGNAVDTTGMSVTLTLPIAESLSEYGGNVKVGCVDTDGSLQKLNANYSTLQGKACVTFVAPHFSPYGFYVDLSNLDAGKMDNSPKTGDPISPKWFLSLGLAALSIFLFLKKDPKGSVQPA